MTAQDRAAHLYLAHTSTPDCPAPAQAPSHSQADTTSRLHYSPVRRLDRFHTSRREGFAPSHSLVQQAVAILSVQSHSHPCHKPRLRPPSDLQETRWHSTSLVQNQATMPERRVSFS